MTGRVDMVDSVGGQPINSRPEGSGIRVLELQWKGVSMDKNYSERDVGNKCIITLNQVKKVITEEKENEQILIRMYEYINDKKINNGKAKSMQTGRSLLQRVCVSWRVGQFLCFMSKLESGSGFVFYALISETRVNMNRWSFFHSSGDNSRPASLPQGKSQENGGKRRGKRRREKSRERRRERRGKQ